MTNKDKKGMFEILQIMVLSPYWGQFVEQKFILSYTFCHTLFCYFNLTDVQQTSLCRRHYLST
jgi:hypothetical protein